MKRIGLLGGMSWESSIEYERVINEVVRERLGGVHSADLIVRSYDFATIEAMQEAGDWATAGRLLAGGALALEASGAEIIVLCTNTMHNVADDIESVLSVPFLHIADATHQAISEVGVEVGVGVEAEIEVVALLGTRYTMEQDFYRGRLEELGLEVLVPDEPDRMMIHDVIFEELVRGVINPSSKDAYIAAVERLVDRGAQGVIAGCTEIELLIGENDVSVPYFPTTLIHATAAANAALA